MDVGDNEKLDSEKRNEDSVSYHTPRFRGAEFVNSSMGVVSDGKGDLLNSMADSYGTTVWDNPSVNQIGLAGGWQEQNSVAKNGFLLPTGSGTIPHLSQLPADSAFIERAARFSYFNSGNIVDLMNTFPMNQPVSPYHQLTSMPCGPIETNPPSTSKDDRRRSPPEKNARRGSETKQSDSDEAESVGGRGEEETSLMDTSTEPSLPKGYGPKKRRRAGQDTELEQSQQLSGEDANGNSKNSSPVKISGKNAKSSSQADPSKEEYIHIRARRGQATNSHSLAERIRREKISERMKFLQDLVPGCSKVTGKAVMLDEIINYVQSLQRQVEFLSMKLATVDPRVDFNIDSLLAKEQLFPTLAGVSSSMGFSPDVQMAYPPIHPSHPIGIHHPVIGNTSDALRNINPQLTGINEATQQMPNVWDYELQNVVQMGFDPNAPIDNQETNNSSLPRMKVEP